MIVDSRQILSAVLKDPARYGFTAPDAATVPACPGGNALGCVRGLNALPDSEQRIFADGLHPTSAAHALLAQATLAGLRAAAQTGTIPVATMTALRQQALALETRLNPTVLCEFDDQGVCLPRAVGDVDYFTSGRIGYYTSDARQIVPGLRATTEVARVGFDVALPHDATVGIELGLDHGQVEFDADRGGFDTRLFSGTLFGQVALSDMAYINAAAGAATINVHSINRGFRLGAAMESYRASSDGSYVFARAGGGAMIEAGEQVTINPFAHFTLETVSIDGFTETSGAASLAFGRTDYTSHRITAGVAAILTPAALPSWTFDIRGSVEHDLKQDDLGVPLGPDPETLANIFVPRPAQTWGYLGLSGAYALSPNAFLGISGSASLGLNGSRGLVGTVAFKSGF